MAERTLTQSELNRALLARQILLERSRLPIPRTLERLDRAVIREARDESERLAAFHA